MKAVDKNGREIKVGDLVVWDGIKYTAEGISPLGFVSLNGSFNGVPLRIASELLLVAEARRAPGRECRISTDIGASAPIVFVCVKIPGECGFSVVTSSAAGIHAGNFDTGEAIAQLASVVYGGKPAFKSSGGITVKALGAAVSVLGAASVDAKVGGES